MALAGGPYLYRRRCRMAGPIQARRSMLTDAAIAAATAPWLVMIFTPNPGGANRVQLVPFGDLVDFWAASPGTLAIQVLGNLTVFAAAGFLAPLRRPEHVPVRRVLARAALASALSEALQWALSLGRVSSVDDVLLNATGAAIGCWLATQSRRVLAHSAAT